LRYPNPAPETSDLCRPERFQRTAAISRSGAVPERDLFVSGSPGSDGSVRSENVMDAWFRCPAATAQKHQDSGFPPFSGLA
jgi:hypothetical protein